MATILIVEDDRITALGLQRHLTRLGHTVLPPVGSAAEALAAVQAHRPEVVLMDIHLRGEVDGLTAGQLIETTTGGAVVYLSGYTLAQLTAQNGGTAPRFHLTKPLAEEVLARTLTRALDYAARQRTLQALRAQAAESRQQVAALQARAKALYQQAAELRQLTQPGPTEAEQEPPVEEH